MFRKRGVGEKVWLAIGPWIAAGAFVGLAAYFAARAVVNFLVAPAVAVVIGGPLFEINSFSINGVEFRYGALLESFAVLAISLVVVRWGAVRAGVREELRDTTNCVECRSVISIQARRCPFCTSVLTHES
jgi:large conductance mechanosensitive channel